MKTPKALALAAIVALGAVALDQVPKVLVRLSLDACTRPPVDACERVSFPGPFGILRTENGASAFGLMSGPTLWVLLCSLVVGLVWVTLRMGLSWRVAGAIGLQVGALVSNVIDRFMFGSVTDFIDLRWSADRGVVANPADIILVIGAILLARAVASESFDSCRRRKRSQPVHEVIQSQS